MTLITNRLYLLDNRYSSKTLKPITNSTSAGVVIATRDPNNVAGFLFRAEAYGSSAPNWFRFKHEATGLYLTSPTASNGEQLIISATGNNVFDVSGADGAGYKLRPTAAPFSFTNVGATNENSSVTLASGADNTNQLFDILLYTPNNVNTPSVSGRIFRHFTQIPVSGVMAGAIVRVYKNGQLIGQATDTELDGTLSVFISAIQAGDSIKVTQEVAGVVSSESAAVIVLQFGKVRQVAATQYQALEMQVTDSSSSTIQDWTGDEGDAIGSVRDTQAEAETDLQNANFTITTL